jgi:spore coat protein A, manganese oxidase
MIAAVAVILAVVIIVPVAYLTLPPTAKNVAKAGMPLNADLIPKFVNQLTGPLPVFKPTVTTDPITGNITGYSYSVTAKQQMQRVLPAPYPETPVFAFGGDAYDPVTGASLGTVYSVPGPTFQTIRGVPVEITWINGITVPEMLPVDPTLHWANPNNISSAVIANTAFPPGYPGAQASVPLVVHLHGAEVQSSSDGNPEAWYTADGKHGPAYNTTRTTTNNSAVYSYPNQQQATTLWYHDHSLGLTRINVLSGLAGLYLISDRNDTVNASMPQGKYDMPLVISDRAFYDNGSLLLSPDGVNPTIHPYWGPEFFGNVTCVNGKAWPNMDVDQGQYRFRITDISNARFYTLSMSNGMSFKLIGSDGGYMKTAVNLTELTVAPAERAEILVDFSALAPGTKVVLMNSANAPFPGGDPVDPNNTAVVMQFTVKASAGHNAAVLPQNLNPTLTGAFPNLPSPVKTRNLTLVEIAGDGGPLASLLNGQMWDAPVSETPTLGTTEDWRIIDGTEDAHPIHIHLIQFQVVSRQTLNIERYMENWTMVNGAPPFMNATIDVNFTPYLTGSPRGPEPYEQGWKDTIQVLPGEVTVLRMRFAPVDYANSTTYPFDATSGPGYIWHCHILDHEDNEMMRPYVVRAA